MCFFYCCHNIETVFADKIVCKIHAKNSRPVFFLTKRCELPDFRLPESGYEVADAPPMEIYLNDPDKTRPEDLRTEICIPIK